MAIQTKGSTAVMARRKEPPAALDYFPTPLWGTRALFKHVLPAAGVSEIGSVWEPACGEGHMAAVISEFASDVLATDVFPYGYGSEHDFLHDGPLGSPDWIITNPPFVRSCEFTLRALKIANKGVAMLVRTQWIEGRGRYEKLFQPYPPTIYAPFVERVPMVKGRWNPKATTASSYAWFVWQRGKPPPTVVFWIPPGCRTELTCPTDRARFAAWTLAPAEAPLFEGSRD